MSMVPSCRTLLAITLVALPSVGCGPNPLVGHWTNQGSTGGADLTTTLALNADGSASLTIVGGGSCTGTLTYEGLNWSSSGSNLTFGGSPSCTGTVVCTISGTTVNLDCSSSASMGPNGSCTFSLANNDNSLTVGSCTGTSGGSTTYMRMPN